MTSDGTAGPASPSPRRVTWTPTRWFWVGLLVVGLLALGSVVMATLYGPSAQDDALFQQPFLRWSGVALGALALTLAAFAPLLRRMSAKRSPDALGDFCFLAAVMLLALGSCAMSGVIMEMAKRAEPDNAISAQGLP